jgi:hypothetical protein
MALRPKEPIVGAITQTDTDKWLAWTDGKPKADWTGLEDVSPDCETPNQMRPV